MARLFEQLNRETADLVESVRPSLVRILSGHTGSGSGIVLHPDGLILTAGHVIDAARSRSQLRVVLPDDRVLRPSMVVRDEERDLAVLVVQARTLDGVQQRTLDDVQQRTLDGIQQRTLDGVQQRTLDGIQQRTLQGAEASELPGLEFGDSQGLVAGQWVLALGFPWGVAGAATAGVVTEVGPQWPPEEAGRRMGRGAQDWIAVNLRLRPGHSGGPLVDARGRLVGVNTLLVGPDIGMAIPGHVVKRFLRRALATRGQTSRVAA
jgi:S1-C subfamily serine protease